VWITNASGSVTSADALLSLTPTSPLNFDSISLLPDGQLHLVLSGAPGFSVQLLGSTNLSDWSVLTNFPNPSGISQLTNTPTPDVPNQCYRAQYP